MEHSSCGHASQDTLNMEHCVLIEEGLLCVAPEQILLIRKKTQWKRDKTKKLFNNEHTGAGDCSERCPKIWSGTFVKGTRF